MESQYSFGSFEASSNTEKRSHGQHQHNRASDPANAPQTPSHPSMPISSTVKAVPRSGIRDVFDRALAGDADELREGLRRLRSFAEQI